MEDKNIQCLDCHTDFTFTKGEQEFFDRQGFAHPKRCKNCRAKRKAQRNG